MDESYEKILLRALVDRIRQLSLDESLICDELRWGSLLESEEWLQAQRQIDNIHGPDGPTIL